MIAFISDIHGNLAALEAVFADIDRLGGVTGIYCLGDVVGYGPDPIACLELVADRCKSMLMGNHEHAVLHGAYGFHAGAKRAIEWTREAIDRLEPPARRRAVLHLLENLPTQHDIGRQPGELLLVHGSPRDPVMEYVLESDLWEGSDPEKMEQIFSGFARLCFVGHTHRPGIFTADRCFLAAPEVADGFDVGDGQYLVNVGSVGQPRDRDPRACYTVYKDGAVYFRRVAYDLDATMRRFRAVPALDVRFAERLQRGE
jgi:diadenosine tetraphosphatase ApaH/serine/threonine PP2A family protein phosphatase